MNCKLRVTWLLVAAMVVLLLVPAYAGEKTVIKEPDYFCITAEGGDVRLKLSQATEFDSDVELMYATGSDERGEWSGYEIGSFIDLSDGEKLWMRASDNNALFSGSDTDYYHFEYDDSKDGTITVSGNIMTLLDKDGEVEDVPEYGFTSLFEDFSILTDAGELMLPGNLSENCYSFMFYGCDELVNAPKLPAELLAAGCYEGMFSGCAKLAAAPELPAGRLVEGCYNKMFMLCSELSYVKVGFASWSDGCTNLWLRSVSETGTFDKPEELEEVTDLRGNYIPEGWVVATHSQAEPIEEPNIDTDDDNGGTGRSYVSGGGTTAFDTGDWGRPVTVGTWKYEPEVDKWSYTTSRMFCETWGYIYNPYATGEQHRTDWFYFDGTGRMLTGWQWIKGRDGVMRCYFLNPVSDNTLGACFIGPGVTPDGYEVDANGAWIER